MYNQVSWVLQVNIKEGQLDSFKSLMNEMVETTSSNEPGALNYEWNISSDGQSCHIHERYADSDATMIHLGTFGEHFAERFLAIVEPTRFTVYGSPNESVRAVLDGFGAVYMTPIGGFAR